MSVTFNVATDQTMGHRDDRGPSCNFHNVGAADVLNLLNLPTEPCGFLAGEAIPEIRRAIVRLLSVPSARQPAVREGEAHGRCQVMPQTDERVQGRLRELDAVLAHAQKVGGHIVWG